MPRQPARPSPTTRRSSARAQPLQSFMKNIALIGSTGSIGRQVLNVCRRHKDKFNIVSLSAGSNKDLFLEQVKEFKPKIATLGTEITERVNGTEFFGAMREKYGK